MKYNRKALKRLRRQRRIKVQELAERSDLAPGTVRYLDMGVTDPKASTLAKLATVLGCDIREFFVDDGAA